MIYLDNAATTFPKPESVYAEMDRINREHCINAGRGSYKEARAIAGYISDAKNALRKLVNATLDTPVIFSPSITIALNQIVNGINWVEGANVYVSPYEHNAVARTIHKVAKTKSLVVRELPISSSTLEIDIEQIKYEFSKNKPFAIFCTHISNVTGYILPAKEIFDEGKKYHSINVLDTAQSLGLIDVNSRILNADIIAFAGHKSLYGPFGIGGFINVNRVDLFDFITGGTGSDSLNLTMPNNEETKYEPSSMNIVAIAGLNAAINSLEKESTFTHEKMLTDYLVNELSKIKGIQMYNPINSDKHIGIVSFSIASMNSNDVGIILDDDFDIAIRTGYHCAPYIHKYLKDEKTLGTIRVGIGRYTTIEDIEKFLEAIKELAV